MVEPVSNSKNYIRCNFCNNFTFLEDYTKFYPDEPHLFCFHCGELLYDPKKDNFNENKLHVKQNSGTNSTKEAMEKEFYSIMSLITNRRIYLNLTRDKRILESIQSNSGLTEEIFSDHVAKIREYTLQLAFQEDLLQEFSAAYKLIVKRLYHEVCGELMDDDLFKKETRSLFEVRIIRMYAIISGEFGWKHFSKADKHIVVDLIKCYGFKINEPEESYESFESVISLLVSRHTHILLTSREGISFENPEKQIFNSRINELSQELTDYVSGEKFEEDSVSFFEKLNKNKFLKKLYILRSNLIYDWIYRESFVIFASGLIHLISRATKFGVNLENMKGFERKVLDDLVSSLYFNQNNAFPSIFRFNLMMVLSRITYFISRTYPNGPPLKKINTNNNPIKEKIMWFIKRGLINSAGIEPAFSQNLFKYSTQEFNKNLEILIKQLKSDFLFSISFNNYLYDIIERVLQNINIKRKKSDIRDEELVIIKDLSNFNFQWNKEVKVFKIKPLNIKKKRFPANTRLKLIEVIFELMLKGKTENNIILELLKENEVFKAEEPKLQFFEPFVDDYILKLIIISKKFKQRNDIYNKIYSDYLSIHNFAKELREEGITLGISISQLERTLVKLFDHLKAKFNSEFRIERARTGREDVFNNEVLRVNTFIKKLKLTFELDNPNNNDSDLVSNQKFKGKCALKSCDINYFHLPAIEFHHLETEKKRLTFNEIYGKPYEDIKMLLEKDKIIPICRNCHEYYSKILFRDFNSLILKSDLFYSNDGQIRTPEDIDKIINEEIIKCMNSNKTRDYRDFSKESIKFQIKSWIRKRAIIEQLYEGYCQGCHSVSVNDNLPSLVFHHLSPEKKQTYIAKKLPSMNIKEAAKLLIEEECTCLCANCHAIIESKYFFENIERIFHTVDDKGDFYITAPMKAVNDAKSILNKIYKNIEKEQIRIKHIRSLKINDFLKKKYGYGETWKEILVKISNMVNITGKNKFRPSEIKIHNISRYLKKLSEENLVKLIEARKGAHSFYSLTDEGFSKVEEINESWSDIIKIEDPEISK